MEDSKVFEGYLELPDGYQVQLMVLQDYPGGRKKRAIKRSIFRSRIWVGHESEPEPLLHRSQEVADLQLSIDSCYSMLLNVSHTVINSPVALAVLREYVHQYFSGTAKTSIEQQTGSVGKISNLMTNALVN